MKFFAFLAVVCVSTLTVLAQTNEGPLFYLQANSTDPKVDGLYWTLYHTGAGENDVVLTPDARVAQFFNGTELVAPITNSVGQTSFYYAGIYGSAYGQFYSVGQSVDAGAIDGWGYATDGVGLTYSGSDAFMACQFDYADAWSVYFKRNATALPCACADVTFVQVLVQG